jgi:3-hydroxyisobutyrate dehydrogenase-like beta-hydroxyacid dehydrogenase
MTVGLVGLGRMGMAIAQRLREHGRDVTGWDHSAEAMTAAASTGLALAAGVRDIASRADVIISIITDDDGVRHIFAGPDGFLGGDVAGKLFIDMSTLQPMTGRELAPRIAAKGARLIESPVLGTIPQVRAGQLVALIGGDAADLDRARPVLETLTRRIVHMGPNGAGYAMKLVVNLGLGAYIEALSESLALGASQGLTLDQMLDVLPEAPYASGWLKAKTGVLKGERPDMTLDIRTLRKDIMSAVATGALSGVPMPLTSGTLAALSAAVANGQGGGDIAELAKFVREQMVQTKQRK